MVFQISKIARGRISVKPFAEKTWGIMTPHYERFYHERQGSCIRRSLGLLRTHHPARDPERHLQDRRCHHQLISLDSQSEPHKGFAFLIRKIYTSYNETIGYIPCNPPPFPETSPSIFLSQKAHIMNRIQKVKQHLQNNQTVYVVGTTCLVVGGVVGMVATGRVDGPLLAKQINILTNKPTQTIEVFVEALGDPGNIIQDVTTGTIYASQNQAAKALGAYPADVSRHLKGLSNSVKGHKLAKIGKACVPPLGAEAIA